MLKPKAPRPLLTENNRIIINIWLPIVNNQTSDTSNFLKQYSKSQLEQSRHNRIGHVSIQTPKNYASWWPSPDDPRQVEIFNVVKAQNSTYAQDCSDKGEGGKPDVRIALYSLDAKAIDDCFDNIEKAECGYVLAGDKKVTRLFNEEKGQSCCGLAYEILCAGGLLNLSNFHQDLTIKWLITTPNNLAELIINAKKSEMTKYAETLTFAKIDEEYCPPFVKNISDSPVIN